MSVTRLESMAASETRATAEVLKIHPHETVYGVG